MTHISLNLCSLNLCLNRRLCTTYRKKRDGKVMHPRHFLMQHANTHTHTYTRLQSCNILTPVSLSLTCLENLSHAHLTNDLRSQADWGLNVSSFVCGETRIQITSTWRACIWLAGSANELRVENTWWRRDAGSICHKAGESYNQQGLWRAETFGGAGAESSKGAQGSRL